MSNNCELTVVMPCLNEADTLATCIRKAQRGLEAAGVNGEILVADNGSTDGSVEIARQLGVTVDVLAPTAAKQTEPPVVEIAAVQSARRVLLGSDTHFRVTLNGKAATSGDRTLLLHLTEDGKKILDQSLTLKARRQASSCAVPPRCAL